MKWFVTILLMTTTAFAQTTYYVSKQETRRPGRTLPKGSDSHSCEQAKNPATARATINGGIACLSPGDTLHVGAGVYRELLLSSYTGASTCSDGDAAVQQPCALIPNGVSEDRPTSIIGNNEAVISPDRPLPGGGGILTLYDAARYMYFEGLRFVGTQGISGIHFGNAQYITFHSNEVATSYGNTGALVNSSSSSRYNTFTKNEIHHAGSTCDPRTQTSPPCPHGMYVCGQDHWISDNYVHHNANYGIQVSCEQGGIARVTVAMNKVEQNRGTGIRIAGDSNKAFANLLVRNGLGMTITGKALVAHNTFDGVHLETAYDDPFGLWVDGTASTVVNNIFTNQKSSWYIMQQRSGSTFVPVSTSYAHHNGCDASGNPGCTNIHTADTWYADYESGDYSLASNSPAKAAGTPVGVEVDIIHRPYLAPDLGSYAASGTIPPPTPGKLKLACSGELGAEGKIILSCTQE